MANKAGTRTLLGVIPCGTCGGDIPLRQSDTGTINNTCPWCEQVAHARRGTKAHAILVGRIKPGTAPQAQAPAQGTGAAPASVSPGRTEPKAPPKAPPAPVKSVSPFHF